MGDAMPTDEGPHAMRFPIFGLSQMPRGFIRGVMQRTVALEGEMAAQRQANAELQVAVLHAEAQATMPRAEATNVRRAQQVASTAASSTEVSALGDKGKFGKGNDKKGKGFGKARRVTSPRTAGAPLRSWTSSRRSHRKKSLRGCSFRASSSCRT